MECSVVSDIVPVVLYTYAPDSDLGNARCDYARQTLEAFFRYAKTSYSFWLHIADDGSPQNYRDSLWDLAGEYCGDNRSITNSERRGYGGSYNQASWQVHQLNNIKAIIHLEDDWKLSRELDIDPLIDALDKEPLIRCIRMGYIGYTHPIYAQFLWVNETHYLLFDPESPSQYIFSGGPRIETLQYGKDVGLWPEKLGAGETELVVCSRPQARIGVAWPVDLIRPKGDLFIHIGAHVIKNASFSS